MGDSPIYRTKAFISYSHADKAYLERLQKHLKPDLREDSIKVWDDTQIPPGGDWLAAIERALAEAQVAILLVSADFLASDFVTKVELPKILAAARDEGVTVLLVLLGHCGFRRSKLSSFQTINNPEKPLDDLSKPEQDKIWERVAELTIKALKAKEQEWGEKAGSLNEAGKYQEALVAAECALQFNPDNAIALTHKGGALYCLGQWTEALIPLERAVELNPRGSFAQKVKGFTLYSLRRYEEALPALDLALKFDRRDAGNWQFKGAALFQLQRYEEALATLEKALKFFNKGDAFAYKYKGAALYHLQRYEEAVAALEAAGNDAFALKYKGATLFHLEREIEAVAALQRALIEEARQKRELNDAFAFKYLGAAMAHLEVEDAALTMLEEALKLEPNDTFALRYKGAALHSLRKYEEALRVLEQALKIGPDEEALKLKNKVQKILEYKKKLAEAKAAPTPRKATS